MKFSKEKYESFSTSYTRTARANGYKITICYNKYSQSFYFEIVKGDNYYNSCWDKKYYRDEQTCIAAIEQWLKNKK